MLLRLILALLTLLSLAAGSWALVRLHAQDQELVELQRRLEQRGLEAQQLQRSLRRVGEEHAAERAELSRKLEAAEGEQLRLEAELRQELDRRQGVNQRLEDLAAKMQADRERYNRELWAEKKFMPEGLRLALLTLHELLEADGYNGFRFLKAGAIEAKVMRDVQLLERDPGSLSSRLYVAGELRLQLDRSSNTLRLLLSKGFRRGPEGRFELPAEGHGIELSRVDGSSWEQRLPFLVQAEGAYPDPSVRARRPQMAPRERAGWRTRINELLALAKTSLRLRLDSFSYLKDGAYHEALLLGYDAGKLLQMSAEAKRIAVVVQRKTGAVELCCFDGTLREKGGETTMPPAGHRILLRGVTPEKARDVMLGMVIDQ